MGLKSFRCVLTDKEVGFEECVRCARWERKCDFPYPVLKALVPAVKEERDYLEVTEILGCLRKKYLMKIVDYSESPEDLFFMWRGKMKHACIEGYQEGEENGMLVEKVLTKEVEGFKILGRIDEYDTKLKILVDYKTCRSVPKWRPYGDHLKQVSVYKWLLEGNGYEVRRIEVIYVDNDRFKRVVIKEQMNIEPEIIVRARILKQAYNEGVVPPPMGKENDWECSYCPIEVKRECDRIIQEDLKKELVEKIKKGEL